MSTISSVSNPTLGYVASTAVDSPTVSSNFGQTLAVAQAPKSRHSAGCCQRRYSRCRGGDDAARHDGPSIRTASGFAGLVGHYDVTLPQHSPSQRNC